MALAYRVGNALGTWWGKRGWLGKLLTISFLVVGAALVFGNTAPSATPAPATSPQESVATATNTTSIQPQKTPEQKMADARFVKTAMYAQALKKSMREPESFILEGAWANEDASIVCLQYRARNGFGGMNRENVTVANGKTSQEPGFWNTHCKKAGFDMQREVKYVLR